MQLSELDKSGDPLKDISSRLSAIEFAVTDIAALHPGLTSLLNLISNQYKTLINLSSLSLTQAANSKENSLLKSEINELKIGNTTLKIKLEQLEAQSNQMKLEMNDLQEKLKKKYEDVFSDFKSHMIEKLDLDEYNITSDDFRETRRGAKEKSKVPKLDFTKIYKWREKQNDKENKPGDSDVECDIDDDEGVQDGNERHLWKGSDFIVTEQRMHDMKERKQYIIGLMNRAYDDIMLCQTKNAKQKKEEVILDSHLKDSLDH